MIHVLQYLLDLSSQVIIVSIFVNPFAATSTVESGEADPLEAERLRCACECASPPLS